MFSKRAKTLHGTINPLYAERDRRLSRGAPVADLISANVTAQGIGYPASRLKKIMATAMDAAKKYRPDPRGQGVAREALRDYYLGFGLSIPAEQFMLTPGSSLAYLYAFKLLSDPGGEILCPQPSYPLFETLATLCDLAIKPYPLRPTSAGAAGTPRRWAIDFERLEAGISPKTRAIVLVSPHNPTGAVASGGEIEALGQVAAAHNLPIISDEVFSPFVYTGADLPRAAQSAAPLVITLNGLSKMFALPGLKLGWMAVTGKPAFVKPALEALETFSDAFLPVHEAAQFALPKLLEEGAPFLETYCVQIARRQQIALDALGRIPGLSLIPPEGGFYLPLKIENPDCDDERCALDLLRKTGLLLHPGYLYDFDDAHLVLSFTEQPALLKKYLPEIRRYFLAKGKKQGARIPASEPP